MSNIVSHEKSLVHVVMNMCTYVMIPKLILRVATFATLFSISFHFIYLLFYFLKIYLLEISSPFHINQRVIYILVFLKYYFLSFHFFSVNIALMRDIINLLRAGIYYFLNLSTCTMHVKILCIF